MLAVFNTQDERMHKKIKSPIAPLYSLSNVVMFEGLVEGVISCLADQLDKRFAGTGMTFDLGKWLQYFAFDVMGTMSFSKRYGFLDSGKDVEGMLEAISKFMKTAAPRELDAANLSRPHPKWSEVRDLPYLDACVQEGVRIHPPFALPFERVVPTGGVTVLGRYLPEGTLVGGNPYVVNRHESTFGANAEDWDPERWLSGDEGHKKKLEQSVLTVSVALPMYLI
ncbi:hypothetical protein SLS53_001366 [Cytospora paraplurivora]|uniref:Cytochrome P450 n=1 Tax=Cytospora paraplurivora TaxID=2898453 RepID=A0AAN9YMM9_9PEZI